MAACSGSPRLLVDDDGEASAVPGAGLLALITAGDPVVDAGADLAALGLG